MSGLYTFWCILYVDECQGIQDLQSTKEENKDDPYPTTSIDLQSPHDRNWLDQENDIAYKTQSRSCKIQLSSIYTMALHGGHPKAIDREAL